ncbi:AMP-binding protein [Methylopila turkensis]|nr:AMP-binding protein [Methylopila turkensis]
MRLHAASPDPMPNPVAGIATLDEVLSHNAFRDPDGRALSNATLPFRGTWRETNRAVSALAETFAGWRLGPDAVVGVQLGSGPEAALTCLALWRAGLIAALLPLPWRRREMTAALAAVGAQAVVARTEAAGGRPGESACEAAFELDRLRFVATFGPDAPDGATPLDHLLDSAAPSAGERPDRPDDAADHVAVITFDPAATPIARSHNELVALGLAPLLAGRLGGGDRLLSTLDLAGLPGLATGLAPWLVTRATATFHQPSTLEALIEAARDATHVALPGRIMERLVADGAFEGLSPKAVFAAWRAPEPRLSAPVAVPGTEMVDVIALGEIALVASSRAGPARFAAVPLGPFAPEGLAPLIETRVGPDGRLYARGPVCPANVFASPEGAAVAIDAEGFVETGFVGVADRAAGRVMLGGRRRGALQVGGVSVTQVEAERAFAAAGIDGSVDLQDDPVLGARLRLTLKPGADALSADAAALALEEAGFGPALFPRAVVAEPARRTA